MIQSSENFTVIKVLEAFIVYILHLLQENFELKSHIGRYIKIQWQ